MTKARSARIDGLVERLLFWKEAEIVTLREEMAELQYDIERLREALEEIQGHCAYDSPAHEAARAALTGGKNEKA